MQTSTRDAKSILFEICQQNSWPPPCLDTKTIDNGGKPNFQCVLRLTTSTRKPSEREELPPDDNVKVFTSRSDHERKKSAEKESCALALLEIQSNHITKLSDVSHFRDEDIGNIILNSIDDMFGIGPTGDRSPAQLEVFVLGLWESVSKSYVVSMSISSLFLSNKVFNALHKLVPADDLTPVSTMFSVLQSILASEKTARHFDRVGVSFDDTRRTMNCKESRTATSLTVTNDISDERVLIAGVIMPAPKKSKIDPTINANSFSECIGADRTVQVGLIRADSYQPEIVNVSIGTDNEYFLSPFFHNVQQLLNMGDVFVSKPLYNYHTKSPAETPSDRSECSTEQQLRLICDCRVSGDAPKNLLASWLIGYPVYGSVVVSDVSCYRIQNCDLNTITSMMTSSLPSGQFLLPWHRKQLFLGTNLSQQQATLPRIFDPDTWRYAQLKLQLTLLNEFISRRRHVRYEFIDAEMSIPGGLEGTATAIMPGFVLETVRMKLQGENCKNPYGNQCKS